MADCLALEILITAFGTWEAVREGASRLVETNRAPLAWTSGVERVRSEPALKTNLASGGVLINAVLVPPRRAFHAGRPVVCEPRPTLTRDSGPRAIRRAPSPEKD